MIRVADGPAPKTPQATARYIGAHLQGTAEQGNLRLLPGYLSRDGKVTPWGDTKMWEQVGWSNGKIPSQGLIVALTQGFAMDGTRLTAGRSLFRPPKETLITLPSELSEALKQDPNTAQEILLAALDEHHRCLEEAAVRVRTGGGNREWRPARLLTLSYLHAENRHGEAHFHIHCLVFPPALDASGEWRTYDNGAHTRNLSLPGGGRARVTQAIIQEAAAHGYKVSIVPGLASGHCPAGATVQCPDGHLIRAGSVPRLRRAEILAAQELRRELGAPPLTPKELEWLRRASGLSPAPFPEQRLKPALIQKLSTLGLLDPEGRVLPEKFLGVALGHLEGRMTVAQVSLSQFPGLSHASPASEIIKANRKALVASTSGITPDTASIRIRWTAAYELLLESVASQSSGLSSAGLDRRTRDNLSKLKRAGMLQGERVGGRMVYRLAPAGEKRLRDGRQEQQAAEHLVEYLIEIADNPSPAILRGRLAMAGVEIHNGEFRLGGLGRSVKNSSLYRRTRIIGALTPTIPDIPWWEGLWIARRGLPALLQKILLTPAAVAVRWGAYVGNLLTSRLAALHHGWNRGAQATPKEQPQSAFTMTELPKSAMELRELERQQEAIQRHRLEAHDRAAQWSALDHSLARLGSRPAGEGSRHWESSNEHHRGRSR